MPRELGPVDEKVAELAHKFQLATRDQIDKAIRLFPEEPGKDLAEVLVALGGLSVDQAQALREVSTPSSPAATVANAGGVSQTAPIASAGSFPWGLRPADMPSARYSLKEEIGRGGLGRVVEAVDHVFNRTVALKLLVTNVERSILDRFKYEALITGRLDHPHIVAVHDMGVLAGSRDAFFAMKRIHGDDMSKIIKRKSWPQRRLLEAFRDICLAIAYAHSRGVVHRDLKPANVMLGDYGEVFVVDWGLARSMHFEAPGEAIVDGPDATGMEPSRLTLAGSIIGTPQYMSPEQAQGQIEAVDELSDVYSLGAILYQILSGRAPFDGEDARAVIRKVRSEPPVPPSQFATVDAQLEAICLKALEKDPKARFPGARALANEVDAHLEGIRDLEHRSGIAQKHIEDAERLAKEWKSVLEEWRAVRLERERSRESPGYKEGLQALRSGWQLEDKLESHARRGLELFHEADIKIGSALSVLPGHAQARRMRATLYWDKFLLAEEEGDQRGMLGARRVLEAVDDGTYSAQTRGEGTLCVETLAWRCPCLSAGRRMNEGDFAILGHDPTAGKRLATADRERGGTQVHRPRFLKVHGDMCPRVPSAGTEVWLYRNLEIDRVLIPSGEGVDPALNPELAIRRLFPENSFKPRGIPTLLGKTPIRDLRVPVGAGLLVLVAEGREPAAVPFSIGRGERVEISATLFSPGEIPHSGRLVTCPPRRSAALRPQSRLEEESGLDGEFFVERFPVTCREYAEFLNSVAGEAPREAMRRVPRAAESSDFYWQEDGRGRYSVPVEHGVAGDGSGEGRDNWREDWPVIGVSWDDAMAFARWKTEKEGRLWSLLPEALWQRAAQGEDRRPFPWGEKRIAWFSHNLESAQGHQRPEPAGARPFDESPFGIRDMAGNVSEWCLDEVAEVGQGLKLARGGNWSTSHLSVDCTTRLVGRADLVHPTIGFRLCAPACLPIKKRRPVVVGS
ncbi:MAG: bifunctional serine/threonine-protein kinase/formylglycine-generating enzyme family protein [Planctomycetota bacterium]